GEDQQQIGFRLPAQNQAAAASSVPRVSNNQYQQGGSSFRQCFKRISRKQWICIGIVVFIILLIIIIIAAVLGSRSSKNET
ncbi:unnamed protein product, partial [Adineta steineri]